MRAAIYARRSKDQNVAEEAKSVTRQVDLARSFASTRGWTVQDHHVYIDDGISGAEFQRRNGLQQMLAHRREFDILIVSEQKSLGREMSETMYLIKQLAEADVEVWGYMEAKSLTPGNWMDKAMSALRSAADEAHREDTSRRVHESHAAKARKGQVTGGRVYGYRNVHVYNGVDVHGNPLRSHVERVIDEVEAPVVRYIFELYASGLGLKAVARRLTQEGAPPPKPFLRQDKRYVEPLATWAPATVRSILNRDLYRGMVVWNKSRKRTNYGKVDQKRRPEAEWVTASVPHLRIVSDELWRRATDRRKETATKTLRFASGRLSGRPPKHTTQNLLAGLASCGVCGGGIVVCTTPRKAGRAHEYCCFRHRTNVDLCSNALRIRIETVNEAVLSAIEEHVFTPKAVEQVILFTERDDHTDRQKALDREAKDMAKRITNITKAIEQGGDIPSLGTRLRELEARKEAITSEQASLRPLPRLEPAVVESTLDEWRRLLRQSTTQSRAVLQRVLQGRIIFHPCPEGGYTFEAHTRFDRLFSGVAVPVPAYIPDYIPNGTEGTTHIRYEDTIEADYSALLARAQQRYARSHSLDTDAGAKRVASPKAAVPLGSAKRVASPAGFEPASPP